MPLQVIAVGDISLGDHPVRVGHGTASRCRRWGPDEPFRLAGPLLDGGDLVIGNLETVLDDPPEGSCQLEQLELRGPSAGAGALRRAGFHLLNLANNHSAQHGPEAFERTVQRLAAMEVGVVGRAGGEAGVEVVIREVQGIRVGVLGACLCREKYAPGQQLYFETDPDGLVAAVAAARPGCDLLVVSVHWGWEYLVEPTPGQRHLARRLADVGAGLVIGHHPHVLQPVERLGGCLVCYSLGNFVFDHHFRDSRSSAAVVIEWGGVGLIDWRVRPAMINRRGQPAPAAGRADPRVRARLAAPLPPLPAADSPAAVDQEAEAARVAQRRYLMGRMASYLYFLTRLPRYSPAILTRSVWRAFRRRWQECRGQDRVV